MSEQTYIIPNSERTPTSNPEGKAFSNNERVDLGFGRNLKKNLGEVNALKDVEKALASYAAEGTRQLEAYANANVDSGIRQLEDHANAVEARRAPVPNLSYAFWASKSLKQGLRPNHIDVTNLDDNQN